MPGEDDPLGAAEVGAGNDRVAVAEQLQLRDGTEGMFHGVGQPVFLPETLKISMMSAVSSATSWRRFRRAGAVFSVTVPLYMPAVSSPCGARLRPVRAVESAPLHATWAATGFGRRARRL